jgi:hypothetical protein
MRYWDVGLGRSLPHIFCIHVRSGPIYWGGGYLPCKKNYKVMVLTCKKLENIICDGILHVNMFHYFKIPYFTCNFLTKFTYNEYIEPYFLSHVVLRFSPNDLPEDVGLVDQGLHYVSHCLMDRGASHGFGLGVGHCSHGDGGMHNEVNKNSLGVRRANRCATWCRLPG